jgi:hypothetical protein
MIKKKKRVRKNNRMSYTPLSHLREGLNVHLVFETIVFNYSLQFLTLVCKCKQWFTLDSFSSSSAVPSSPGSIKVKDVGKDYVKVEWTTPKDDGGSKVTGYTVYYREDGTDEWKKAGSVGSLDSQFTVKNLLEGKKYYFAVSAENKQGLGAKMETDSPASPKKPARKWLWLFFCLSSKELLIRLLR